MWLAWVLLLKQWLFDAIRILMFWMIGRAGTWSLSGARGGFVRSFPSFKTEIGFGISSALFFVLICEPYHQRLELPVRISRPYSRNHPRFRLQLFGTEVRTSLITFHSQAASFTKDEFQVLSMMPAWRSDWKLSNERKSTAKVRNGQFPTKFRAFADEHSPRKHFTVVVSGSVYEGSVD